MRVQIRRSCSSAFLKKLPTKKGKVHDSKDTHDNNDKVNSPDILLLTETIEVNQLDPVPIFISQAV